MFFMDAIIEGQKHFLFSTGYFPFLNLPTNLGVWWITQEWATRPFWVKYIVAGLYPGPGNLLKSLEFKISEKYFLIFKFEYQ